MRFPLSTSIARCALAALGALVCIGFIVPILTFAQTPGTCEIGEATATLDVNNVRASLYNSGNLFWNGSDWVYNVPKAPDNEDSDLNAIFTMSFWIGGKVDGEIRLVDNSGAYGPWEFWPGPLNEDGSPPPDCSVYDHIYSIYRDDIRHYNQTGDATPDLAQWPWEQGAPVLDGDGNPSNYDLEAGDRPALIGDQMAWWIMNDAGNVQSRTITPPIGLEARVTAFAFDAPGDFGNTTFYRYRLRYRGTEPLEDAWLGFYVFPLLGDTQDNYIGTDTILRMAYVYNADNFDEHSTGIEDGYLEAPPALGFSFLQGLRIKKDAEDKDGDGLTDEVGEQPGLTRTLWNYGTLLNYFGNDEEQVHVRYDALRGYYYRVNGLPTCYGGTGVPPSCIGEPTPFFFTGDPVTKSYWSEFNIDNKGTANRPGERTFIMSSGPFRMEPGDEQEFTLAIVWARGDDHLDSVSKLRIAMRTVQQQFPVVITDPTLIKGKLPSANAYARNYPNPFTETTTIHYELADPAPVRLAVYDVLGREVATLVDRTQEAGFYNVEFDGRDVPAGVYVYRLQVSTAIASETMVLMR